MYVNLKTSRASIVEMVTVFFPMLASRRPCHSEKKNANRGVAGDSAIFSRGWRIREWIRREWHWTRPFTNPLTASPLAFTVSLPKQKHSCAKSRQLRSQYVYTIFLQLLLVVHSLFLPLRFVKVLTLVKGPFARLGPNVLKSVLLRVGADQAESNACVTAAVVSVAWRKVSHLILTQVKARIQTYRL